MLAELGVAGDLFPFLLEACDFLVDLGVFAGEVRVYKIPRAEHGV